MHQACLSLYRHRHTDFWKSQASWCDLSCRDGGVCGGVPAGSKPRLELQEFRLSLRGATGLAHDAVSTLLRLPVLTELDVSGCSRVSAMNKMRLVAKVGVRPPAPPRSLRFCISRLSAGLTSGRVEPWRSLNFAVERCAAASRGGVQLHQALRDVYHHSAAGGRVSASRRVCRCV